MEWTAKISEVGPNAIDPKENIIILFGSDAVSELKNVSVIQGFNSSSDLKKFNFEQGDEIVIHDKPYKAIGVGDLVNTDMFEMGHVTLVFIDEVPQKLMRNAIYLQKPDSETIPIFKVNDTITYKHREELN